MDELDEKVALSIGLKELQLHKLSIELNRLSRELDEALKDKEELQSKYDSLKETVEGK